MPGFRDFAIDAVLRDGGSIHIRAIRPDDKQRLADHFHGLSPRSVHFRFFGAKRRLSDGELQRFTEVDFVRDAALVATLRDNQHESIIGVGRYIGTAEGRAEVAFAVADADQGRGIGGVLLQHLADIARANGVREFEADVLGENNRMLAVFRRSGYRVTRSTASGVVHLSFPTGQTPEVKRVSLDREVAAAGESVRHFLYPASVAVIGASERRDSIGRVVIENLLRSGYRGGIHPVHPRHAKVAGLRAFRSLAAIGAPVDLAMVAVPREAVEEVLDACAENGVRAVAVLSAGFGDASEEGRIAEKALARRARERGMRLLGPNCLGVVNFSAEAPMNATFALRIPGPGSVSIAAQSGALGVALLDHAAAAGLGLAGFVSLGNNVDVSGNDLLSYWSTDPGTRAMALYLESVGNARHFARLAPRVAQEKAIVVVKSGRAPQRRESGDLGRLADLDLAAAALFEQAGVMRTTTIEEMFDLLALVSSQPLPNGSRVGVVTNADGPAVLLADALASRGLELASFDPGTAAALTRVVAAGQRVGNPLLLPGNAKAAVYAKALAVVGADLCVDAVVAIHVPTLATVNADIATGIARGAADVAPDKPVASVFLSSRGTPEEMHRGGRGRLPVYRFPENVAAALSAAERLARWRRRPRGRCLELEASAVDTVRAVIDRAPAPGWLQPADVAVLLRAAGIAYAESYRVDAQEAGEFAETLGYPLVAKAVATNLTQRRDKGCVALGLRSRAEVERAVVDLGRRVEEMELALEGVLLQRDYSDGVEAIAGVTTDAVFGPLIAFGVGRLLVDVAGDLAVRLTPLTDVEATAMVDSVRGATLLEGHDRAGLEVVLARLSALVEVAPEIRALELDPISVLATGAMVLGARVRV